VPARGFSTPDLKSDPFFLLRAFLTPPPVLFGAEPQKQKPSYGRCPSPLIQTYLSFPEQIGFKRKSIPPSSTTPFFLSILGPASSPHVCFNPTPPRNYRCLVLPPAFLEIGGRGEFFTCRRQFFITITPPFLSFTQRAESPPFYSSVCLIYCRSSQLTVVFFLVFHQSSVPCTE